MTENGNSTNIASEQFGILSSIDTNQYVTYHHQYVPYTMQNLNETYTKSLMFH